MNLGVEVNTGAAVAGLAVVACGLAARHALLQRRGWHVRRRLGVHTSTARRPLALPGTPSWLGPALDEAELRVDPDRAWALWLALALVGAGAGAALGGPVLGVGGGALGALTPPVLLRARRGTAAASAERALPGALESVARSLRSGGSLRQAVAEAAAVTPAALGSELETVAAAADRGTPLVSALEGWGARCPRAGVSLAVAALCLGAETGGAQARAVDGVAATLRERLAVEGEVRALTSQTRASMLVIAAAPIAFCGFASATDSHTSSFLFRSPFGLVCLVAGIALDVVGAFWMRRLCRVL